MATTLNRIGTANAYDSSVRNISTRQAALSNLQENLTSGKKVVRASDDPTSAANAERALNRIGRIATDQRALESQRNAILQAEGTLGDVSNALQRFRELVINAGNGINSSAERRSIANELKGLRDQVFSLANTKDTNGLPLFSALGSALAPFVGPQPTQPDYTFQGLPGQSASSEVAIPFALDGDSAFMLQAGRDGVYSSVTTLATVVPAARTHTPSLEITRNPDTASTASTLSSDRAFTATVTAMSFVTDPLTGANVGRAEVTISQPQVAPASGTDTKVFTSEFDPNLPITITIPDPDFPGEVGIPGLQINIKGDIRLNDAFSKEPIVSVFSVLDNAIRDIGGAADGTAASVAVAQALTNLDISMERVSAIRGQAGDLLNRADRITNIQGGRTIQLQADRSRAEDLDMVQGISDFNNQQTGYQAALQTYAKVQQLSLFNFL
jgi:flagellar hook-associated protein 3 FlgL